MITQPPYCESVDPGIGTLTLLHFSAGKVILTDNSGVVEVCKQGLQGTHSMTQEKLVLRLV